MKLNRRDLQTVEMQIGPMIDIVFLLLIFFLVTAKPVKPENDIGLRLPGTVEQEEVIDLPDEQRVEIRDNGQIVLNDLPLDSPESKDLPELKKTMIRFKEACDANNAAPLVTIAAEDEVYHQRIIDVLNILATAGINGVTLATDEEEDSF